MCEFDDNFIILQNEQGNDERFEFLDLIEYDDREFIILLPVISDDEGVVVILEVVGDEEDMDDDSDTESYVSVEDEYVLSVVYEIFKKRHMEEFNFIDE